ncbi:MAG: hypothetical protein RL634_473 [Bacteroidota bacterium]
MKESFIYKTAVDSQHFNDAKHLFKEYALSLDISLDFQHFNEELDIVESMYGAPTGILYIVYYQEKAVACAALRKIGEGICEVKRMYVQTSFRRFKIGDTLIDLLVTKATNMGYSLMRLDTLDSMTPAISLYKKHGFYEIEAYYFNPNKNTVYMEKKLLD